MSKERFVGWVTLVVILSATVSFLSYQAEAVVHQQQPAGLRVLREARVVNHFPPSPKLRRDRPRNDGAKVAKLIRKAKPVAKVQRKIPVIHHAKKSKVKHRSKWVVQVASFSKKTAANHLVKRLKRKGFHAFAKTTRYKKRRTITRVYVGPAKQPQARQWARKIEKSFKLKVMVKRT